MNTAFCETCGSVNVVRAPSGLIDRAINTVTGLKPFVCRRCGWRGRREWGNGDLVDYSGLGLSGDAVDPSLTILDQPRSAGQRTGKALKPPKRHGRRGDRRRKPRRPLPEEFDLSGIAREPAISSNQEHRSEAGDAAAAADAEKTTAQLKRGASANRRKRARRLEIAGALTISLFLMLLVAIVTSIGSCILQPGI